MYTFEDYVHNYAVWTAARAVQRNFATTSTISKAIAKSGLRAFVKDNSIKTQDEFDRFHSVCANQLIQALQELGLEEPTYGRAAKIIAIYLKTAVVIRLPENDSFAALIHPPIDSILLRNLCKASKMKKSQFTPWTQMNESQYKDLVNLLRNNVEAFNWRLEVYWRPELE